EDRDQDHEHQEHERGQRELVVLEAPPEELPRRASGDQGRIELNELRAGAYRGAGRLLAKLTRLQGLDASRGVQDVLPILATPGEPESDLAAHSEHHKPKRFSPTGWPASLQDGGGARRRAPSLSARCRARRSRR